MIFYFILSFEVGTEDLRKARACHTGMQAHLNYTFSSSWRRGLLESYGSRETSSAGAAQSDWQERLAGEHTEESRRRRLQTCENLSGQWEDDAALEVV